MTSNLRHTLRQSPEIDSCFNNETPNAALEVAAEQPRRSARSGIAGRCRRRAGHNRRRRARLGFEPLESRLLLTAQPTDILSVGRLLSAWSAADVTDRTLTIEYTVYNQQPRRVEAVSLVTELEAGVGLQSATDDPTVVGAQLTWDLGTLEPFASAAVAITVTLADPMPLQLDGGAEAFGAVDARAIHDAARPAMLRADALDPDVLAATPDANSADPFIQAQAAALNQDPEEIFAFVRDEIGFESYVGSLRGARGTLWSGAGNSIDQASLTVALLRASGVPAHYAQGTLQDADAQTLIASMFPDPFQAVGLVPIGADVADPLNDAGLLDETRDHVWVQFDDGLGSQDADPAFATADIGDAFAAIDATFAETPTDLRHSVTVRLDRELAIPAAGRLVGGSPLNTATVLDLTFDSAQLVGKPLTIGHFVDQQSLGTPLFTSITNTYAPYLLVGDEALPLIDSELISGTAYQEVITNFPLSTQLLTGLFVEIELTDPTGTTSTFSRTLADRIGFDIRQNGGTPDLTFDENSPPLLTDMDAFTIYALPGTGNPRGSAAFPAELADAIAQLQASDAIDPASNDTRALLASQQGLTRVFGDVLLRFSDIHTAQLAEGSLVKAYFDQPRLVVVANQLDLEAADEDALRLSIDLMRNQIRTIPYPGQNAAAGAAFNIARGLFENANEENALARASTDPARVPASVGTFGVLEAAVAQGISLVAITDDTRWQLDALTISLEAKGRISASLGAGKLVLVPSQMVPLDGRDEIAWFLFDGTTGETIGVNEDGSHGAIVEFVFDEIVNFVKSKFMESVGSFLSATHGFTAGSILSTSYQLCLVAAAPDGSAGCEAELALDKSRIEDLYEDIADIAEKFELSVDADAFKNLLRSTVRGLVGADPPVSEVLIDPQISPLPINHVAFGQLAVAATGGPLTVAADPAALTADQLTPADFQLQITTDLADTYDVRVEAPLGWTVSIDAAGEVTVAPAPGVQGGNFPIFVSVRSQSDPTNIAATEATVTVTPTTPALLLSVDPDPQFYLEHNGGQLPTAFRATIQNQGGQPETIDITFPSVPAGFELRTSLPSVTIPAGETGIVGLYLEPTGPLAAPGSDATFEVMVASQSNAAINDAEVVAFSLPAVHGVALTADPRSVSAIPGAAVEVALTIASAGNVAEDVTFDVVASNGVLLSGLSPTSLAAGGSEVQLLTLTPEAGTPLNSLLNATIIAHFDGSEPVSLTIPLHVVAPGAEAIQAGSNAAEDLGNDALAQRLNDLGGALTNLSAESDNTVFLGQTLAALDAVIDLASADAVLADFIGPLATAHDVLDSADETEIAAAIAALGNALDDFAAALQALAAGNFELFLGPSSQPAQPAVPREFSLRIRNIGTQTTTYDLSIVDLPADVVGNVSDTSVELARGEVANVVVTLTQTTLDERLAFEFHVEAAIAGASPAISKSVVGSLRTRDAFVSVTDIELSPPFVDPGQAVDITARLLNAVNRQQTGSAFFSVADSSGVEVFSSAASPAAVALGVTTSLVDVPLGNFDTTGLPLGEYTIAVTVLDENGDPLPGGTGESVLLVGSPVTASLDVAPQQLPPGTSTVTHTLQVDGQVSTGDPLDVVALLPIADFNNDFLRGVTISGDLAYVFGNFGVHVVDVADVQSLERLRQTGGGALARGVVAGNRLVAIEPGAGSPVAAFSNFGLVNFDLSGAFQSSSPENPRRTNRVAVNYIFPGGLAVQGDAAFVSTLLVGQNIGQGDITYQNGTVLSFDISDPFNQQFSDSLLNVNGLNGQAPLFRNGGDFNMFTVVSPRADTLLVTSTTSTGGMDTQDGVGRVLVVDISDPTNINSDPPNPNKIVGELQIPGAVFAQSMVIDGDLLFVVATEGGWLDPFDPMVIQDIGPTGNLVLATIDISDPRSPTLTHSEVVPRAARGAGNLVSIGGGRFAFSSLGRVNDTPQLFLVDASDPGDIVIVEQIETASAVQGLGSDGQFLYASSSDGLTVYALGATAIPVTASVQTPHGTGVSIVPGSFNVAPTEIQVGPEFDTLIWDFTLDENMTGQTITWQSQVTGLEPGASRQVTLDGTVDFASNGTAGSIPLPPQDVFAAQILSLDPAEQTAQPGEPVGFTLTVVNPTAVETTFDLITAGVPAAWIDLASQVTVPAGGMVEVPLALTPDPFAPDGDHVFVVTASNGFSGSVDGVVSVAGEPILAPVDAESRGVVVALLPTSAAVGQGGAATFTARVTNTGSATASFDLSLSGLPVEFGVAFSRDTVEVPPGASNARDVVVTIATPLGATPEAYPFELIAEAAGDDTSTTADATVTVLSAGVDVSLTPSSTGPGGSFEVTITNTGAGPGTFDLTLSAPAALAATLGASSVALGPGASQQIALDIHEIDFALPGDLTIVVTATAQADAAVSDSAMARIDVDEARGVGASFDPPQVDLLEPSETSLMLNVRNLGNIEDAYSATITTTSGPVVAGLVDAADAGTDTIPLFRLPGLANGRITVTAELTSPGTGVVTVAVNSLADGLVAAEATAVVTTCPWNNFQNHLDSNGDTAVTSNDVLVIINQLNIPTVIDDMRRLAPRSDNVQPPPFYDVTCDGFATPQDVLLIINFLNALAGGESPEEAESRGSAGVELIRTTALAGAPASSIVEAVSTRLTSVISPSDLPSGFWFARPAEATRSIRTSLQFDADATTTLETHRVIVDAPAALSAVRAEQRWQSRSATVDLESTLVPDLEDLVNELANDISQRAFRA